MTRPPPRSLSDPSQGHHAGHSPTTASGPTRATPVASPLSSEFVYLPVPRSVLAAASPQWVSETTSESVFGLDARRFVRACKAQKIKDAKKDGQLWLAPVVSVVNYLRSLPAPGRAPRAKVSGAPANDDFESLDLPPGVRRV